ncbi:putative protein OS=Tsukamurella paurometabola (strain ATCC 8368 / DSM / CCUG 35730 /CIP 100753 / JCM 10117 / KCTC 9821 / NBRC 16120 / NCIMB 702349/ NCTC 13040) OX=521096 GN=Tpau_3049 PE=4 SV=1 [Tsukamurella paurometabola]|uniref:Uncharacterized protein n=1 Tax=Tsukamurella paurometabola (strain ATCC 8368 / DSM 20162 / CCUG 35730 / CIP 100753 / JCM 10117 / KCTC 9821 / NBRC 16120 / NCIMB 702349 / NCTC 13040) TaxID=521096 RepID=D5UUS4_TSUPD|nr:hypothetical protein [Tsukamurella paurometabola]ADG79642.1 hypothetical protein Tpau_3049 [Tsukamurella paurometabola DSM 20162]SUP36571.1 Uncharacterised protein [Tsukamurella paurometabola]
MTATLRIAFAPHWVNAWFVRIVYRPWVQLDDGVPHLARWRAPIDIPVVAGHRTVTTFLRRRWQSGASPRISQRAITVDVPEGTMLVQVRNGPLNHNPFLPRVAG